MFGASSFLSCACGTSLGPLDMFARVFFVETVQLLILGLFGCACGCVCAAWCECVGVGVDGELRIANYERRIAKSGIPKYELRSADSEIRVTNYEQRSRLYYVVLGLP